MDCKILSSAIFFTLFLKYLGFLPISLKHDDILNNRVKYEKFGVIFSSLHLLIILIYIYMNLSNNEPWISYSTVLSVIWKFISISMSLIVLIMFIYQMMKLKDIVKFFNEMQKFDEDVRKFVSKFNLLKMFNLIKIIFSFRSKFSFQKLNMNIENGLYF